MTHRVLFIFTVLLHTLILCQSQTLNYQCDFDTTLTGDCRFTAITSGLLVSQVTGVLPNGDPKEPFSDVTAILTPTTPNNEYCQLPYPYQPGGWTMHFCRRYGGTNYTCPTASGLGQCTIGKYGSLKLPSTGSSDRTFVADVQRSSSIEQCLDFYYYITDTSENARIQMGWQKDTETQQIVEVKAVTSENKWQHSQTNFTGPSSLSSYQLTYRIIRDTILQSFCFAVDEIKIYDQPCGATSTATTTAAPDSTTTTTSAPERTSTTTSTTVSDDTSTTTTTSASEDTSTTTTTSVSEGISTTTTTTSALEDTSTKTATVPEGTLTTTTSVSEGTSTTTTTTTTTTTSATEGTSTTTTTTTAAPEITTTTTTTTSTTTVEDITTTSTRETTSTTTTTETTTTTVTTSEPLIAIFSCDFSSTSCFQGTEPTITNGIEFTSTNITQPPRAPLSDVTSINQPTTNNETCKLPYQLPMENSTDVTVGDLWFCYNNQCPTESEQSSTCISGTYGYVTIDPSESNKTISSSISGSMMIREWSEEQCLRYYYYFTVYDGMDWGQQLSVSVRWNNESENEMEIDRLSVLDMRENRWYERTRTFTSIATNYTLVFSFEVTDANRTMDYALNETIYFALDTIDVYNRNCDDVIVLSTTSVVTTTVTTMTTTETNVGATDPPKTSDNLGLILGLSLGIGIPALLVLTIGVLFYLKKSKRRRYDTAISDPVAIPMKTRDTRADSDNLTRYVY